MKNLAKKTIIYSMVGIMQIGLSASVALANPGPNDNNRPFEYREGHHDRDHDQERQREHDRRLKEENERHEKEMKRRPHESKREWHERQKYENERHEKELHKIDALRWHNNR